MPACAHLLNAAAAAGEIRTDVDALALMRGVGGLCVGADKLHDYDPRCLIKVLLDGLQR